MDSEDQRIFEGLKNLTLEHFVNIDAYDMENELAQPEYVEDIYAFYRLSENEVGLRDYINSENNGINTALRAILVNGIVEIHEKFDLMPETLYLTISIIDRYLSVTRARSDLLELIGISALLIASKYEEMSPPKVDSLVRISGCKRERILEMEKTIVGQLGWYITVPTAYVFAVRFTKASVPYDNFEMQNMVFFYTELGLLDYMVTIRNSHSRLAASAVYAARYILKKTPIWTQTLTHYTAYSEEQVRDCAFMLVNLHACATESWAVFRKYNCPKLKVDDIQNAQTEYVEDIYAFYRISEHESGLIDYMDSQPNEINSVTRAILVDWIMEVHKKCDLMRESLYLTVSIIDRYLSVTRARSDEFELLGISALLIASKHEEMRPLKVESLVCISGWKRERILEMEKAILGQLGWYITVPTAYIFAVRFTKASIPYDNDEMKNMVFFYIELGLMDYLVMIKNSRSRLAASAVYAARFTLKKAPVWTETLTQYTDYSEEQVRDCAMILVKLHAGASRSRLKQYTGYSEDQVRDCAISLVKSHAGASGSRLKAVCRKCIFPSGCG